MKLTDFGLDSQGLLKAGMRSGSTHVILEGHRVVAFCRQTPVLTYESLGRGIRCMRLENIEGLPLAAGEAVARIE